MDENHFQLVLESRRSALPAVRRALRSWLAPSRLNHQEREDFILAIGEVLANAIIHGNQQEAHRQVHLEGQFEEDGHFITVSIQDEGEGLFAPGELADPLSESGRGLGIARDLVDEFELGSKPGLVILGKRASQVEPL